MATFNWSFRKKDSLPKSTSNGPRKYAKGERNRPSQMTAEKVALANRLKRVKITLPKIEF